jgi:hypothetical protein
LEVYPSKGSAQENSIAMTLYQVRGLYERRIMLSVKEKRFIKYWEEQRKGGRGPYLILYSIVGTLIIAILSFVILLLGIGLFLTPLMLWAVPVGSLAAALVIASSTWQLSEMKFKKIIRREIEKNP